MIEQQLQSRRVFTYLVTGQDWTVCVPLISQHQLKIRNLCRVLLVRSLARLLCSVNVVAVIIECRCYRTDRGGTYVVRKIILARWWRVCVCRQLVVGGELYPLDCVPIAIRLKAKSACSGNNNIITQLLLLIVCDTWMGN